MAEAIYYRRRIRRNPSHIAFDSAPISVVPEVVAGILLHAQT